MILKVSDLTVSFDDKQVFDHAFFEAAQNQLTVVSGKSGIGKSTLINALLFQHPCSYTYGDQDLSRMNEQEKADFLYRHVSVVLQEPLLDDDLTIQQHRDFFLDLYHTDDTQEDLVRLMNLEGLSEKYPGQLSGGERTRTALYLALLKNPDILILDEPTASLDAENKSTVIQILKEYGKTHMVICSSHDQELNDAADTVKMIENGKIVTIREREEAAVHEVRKNESNDFPGFLRIIRQEEHHHLLLKTFRMVVLAVSTVLLFASLTFNSGHIQQLSDELDLFGSKELIIYHSVDHYPYGYSYVGKEFPLSQEEAEAIRSMESLEYAAPRIDCNHQFNHASLSPEEESRFSNGWIRMILDDGTEKELTAEDVSYHFHTYDEIKYAETEMAEEFLTEGVVLTDRLYTELTGNTETERCEIEFYLPVPVYNESGNRTTSFTAEGKNYENVPVNAYYVVPVLVKMEVRAVLKGKEFGLSDHTDAVYIPAETWLAYIEEYAGKTDVQDKVERYLVNRYLPETDTHIYAMYEELPEEYADFPLNDGMYTHDRLFVDTKWQPNAYTAHLRDITDLPETVTALKEMGLDVDNEYLDTSHLLIVQKDFKRNLILFSIIFFLIIQAGSFLQQLMLREQMGKQEQFLRLNGFSLKQRDRYFRTRLLYHTGIYFLIGVILAFGLQRMMLETWHAYFRISPGVYAGILATAFLSESVYPLLLKKTVH